MIDNDHTYIFIDESGDPGFRLSAGSSSIFCLAAVLFDTKEDIAVTAQAIYELKASLHLPKHHEFRFNSESNAFRTAFCRAVADCPFSVRVIVIDKALIREDAQLRRSTKYCYHYATKLLLERNLGDITRAKLVIDGQANPELRDYLRKQLNREKRIITSVEFNDSKRNVMIQLADMVAGSIARSYKPGVTDGDVCRYLLRRRIEDILELGEKSGSNK